MGETTVGLYDSNQRLFVGIFNRNPRQDVSKEYGQLTEVAHKVSLAREDPLAVNGQLSHEPYEALESYGGSPLDSTHAYIQAA